MGEACESTDPVPGTLHRKKSATKPPFPATQKPLPLIQDYRPEALNPNL